jgi:N-acetylmuramoyl-L-alanine amidase
MNRIDFIAVHCSATPATLDWDVEDVRRSHRQRGWRDVGYHYIIKRDGTLQKGRPDNIPGAHEPRINRNSIAICMIGGSPPIGSPEHRKGLGENNFTEAQWKTLAQIVRELHAKHPAAEIIGHRDVPGVRKACPSFDVKTWWASTKP